MVDKTDPICGMEGHILKHDHYFCSDDCIAKYEKQEGLKVSKPSYSKIELGIPVGLIVILLLGLVSGFFVMDYMILFMGAFFVVVSLLKFLDWKGFSEAFAQYDLIAMKSSFYARIYPIIELLLGIAFLLSFQIFYTSIITFLVMSIGALGVGKNLMRKNPVRCACLGTKVNIPLTKFTLVEDIIMSLMALRLILVGVGI